MGGEECEDDAADESLLDKHAKKWFAKKEINDCREYEAARVATAAAKHAAGCMRSRRHGWCPVSDPASR